VLHQLTLEWKGGRHTMPIGLRSLRVEGERVLLNEQPIWLQGFGQHEVAPGNGPIVPLDLRRRDLEQMKRVFDANVIRPGHYPNHPDLYNLCDELGLLVFSEIPIWHMSSAILASDDVWELWVEPQLREMVESQRGHPSVCFWGIANETRNAHAYYRRGADTVRKLDPSRPVSVVLEYDQLRPVRRDGVEVARGRGSI
jgi:beta-galactosidase/beta-glucuronidase